MKLSAMDYQKLKQDVFVMLCNSAVCIMNYNTKLVPTTYISQRFKVSRYIIRKIMQELKADGLVESGWDSWYCTYNEQQIIARGFTITKKAESTEVYIKAKELEEKLIQESLSSIPK